MLKIPLPPRLLLLAVPALLLGACRQTEPPVSTPSPSRFERVTVTAPPGEAQCDDDGDGVTEACLSQEQVDNLFNEVVTALCEANDRLAWLSDYYLGTKLPASCEERAPQK